MNGENNYLTKEEFLTLLDEASTVIESEAEDNEVRSVKRWMAVVLDYINEETL